MPYCVEHKTLGWLRNFEAWGKHSGHIALNPNCGIERKKRDPYRHQTCGRSPVSWTSPWGMCSPAWWRKQADSCHCPGSVSPFWHRRKGKEGNRLKQVIGSRGLWGMFGNSPSFHYGCQARLMGGMRLHWYIKGVHHSVSGLHFVLNYI